MSFGFRCFFWSHLRFLLFTLLHQLLHCRCLTIDDQLFSYRHLVNGAYRLLLLLVTLQQPISDAF